MLCAGGLGAACSMSVTHFAVCQGEDDAYSLEAMLTSYLSPAAQCCCMMWLADRLNKSTTDICSAVAILAAAAKTGGVQSSAAESQGQGCLPARCQCPRLEGAGPQSQTGQSRTAAPHPGLHGPGGRSAPHGYLSHVLANIRCSHAGPCTTRPGPSKLLRCCCCRCLVGYVRSGPQSLMAFPFALSRHSRGRASSP